MIYNNLAFLADADTGGVVVGVRVPIVSTRDTAAARRLSAATPPLYADARWGAIRTAC
jgi:phosphate acetyltransferase